MNDMRNGACRHCGQIMNTAALELQTQEEADEYATSHCSCTDAQRYRENIELIERRRKEREATLKRAAEEIEELCGEGAKQYGLRPIGDEIKEMLNQAAVFIYDDKMKSTTFSVTAAIKVKIDKSAKGILQIHRSDVAAFKHEV